MRALLLAGVGIVAFGGAAMADGERGRHHRYQPAIMDHYAAALGVNIGQVRGNTSTTGRGQAVGVTTTGSFGAARGVMNVNQNAGANSAQQNAVAIAYIEGCNCEVEFKYGDGNANAVAGNGGQVVGNSSANGGYSRYSRDSDGTSASATLAGSFGGATGIAQVNQNAGANSLQQNATAVAYVDNLAGTRSQDRDAWAIAGNAGRVMRNGSDDYRHRANGSIDGAFAGFTGVANVNQNVGANSLQQNSAALSAVEFCECATRDLSTVVAAAANLGSVSYNRADADRGGAFATIGGSFNGMTGITQVNQNAGANSLMQNSVAVGAVYNR
jgi:hypothetical protein